MSHSPKHDGKRDLEDRDQFLEDSEDLFSDDPELPPLDQLMASLDEADPQTRAEAISELWVYAESEILERLLDLAQNDPDETVRCRAISGLGRYVWEANIIDLEYPDPYMDAWLTHDDFDRLRGFLLGVYHDEKRSLDEQRYAVEALSFLNDQIVTSLITELYARPEKLAKISALFAMGRNGAEHWESILAREIWSRDKELRIEAIDAAGEMQAESLGKDLWRMTYDQDKAVVMAAIFSLGQTGWEEAFERLDELTLHADPEIREVADAAMDEWMLFSQMEGEDEEGWEDEEDQDSENDWMQ